MQRSVTYVLSVALSVLLHACAGTQPPEHESAADMPKLQRQLLARPDDPAILRDLGVLYFRAREYEQAKVHLARSYAKASGDPRTIFYHGLTLEYLGDERGAFTVYTAYTDVPASSRYRKLIEGRYLALRREIVRRQFQQILNDEQRLGTERLAPKAVAVFPLAYQGTDPKYDALGKGLSEMMLVDLGQVGGLQVIERIRIQTLLDELKFGQSSAVDRATAPRLGKLLSAGKIVAGTFNVFSFNLRMDVAAWDVVSRKFPGFSTQTDELTNLFTMEKELVFRVITELGITLTPQEREKILFVPTKNTFAFLMYCMGLKNEDAFDYPAAKVYYNQAASLDPGFALAATRGAAMDALILAGGSKESAALAAETLESGSKETAGSYQNNPVLDRLIHLGFGIGSTFTSGEDDRKGAEEADRAGAAIGRLPEPPPPPPR